MYYTPSRSQSNADSRGVTIRQAAAEEWDAIDRLAQLDSAPPPPRDAMLLAEVGGELQAAVSVRDGYAVANPFEHTSELIDLLRARAAQLREAETGAVDRRRGAPLFSLGWLRGPDRSQAR